MHVFRLWGSSASPRPELNAYQGRTGLQSLALCPSCAEDVFKHTGRYYANDFKFAPHAFSYRWDRGGSGSYCSGSTLGRASPTTAADIPAPTSDSQHCEVRVKSSDDSAVISCHSFRPRRRRPLGANRLDDDGNANSGCKMETPSPRLDQARCGRPVQYTAFLATNCSRMIASRNTIACRIAPLPRVQQVNMWRPVGMCQRHLR